MKRFILPALSLIFITTACSPKSVSTKSSSDQKNENKKEFKELWVMSYNVENLFDTKDDPKKNDETYLPIKLKRNNKEITKKCKKSGKAHWVKECLNTNWNDFKLNLKMKRLKKVITAFNKGQGPDVLILQEIENLDTLKKLQTEYLKKQNYIEAVLIESPDRRGIDVGILSKLKLSKKPTAHLQDFNRNKPTRNMIEANFTLDNNNTLTVIGVHFPSQGSKTTYRRQSVNKLNSVLKTIPKKNLVIAGGDFNITVSEEKKHNLFSKTLSSSWSVSHLVGCQSCHGTHYYHRKKSWSFLDALLFSKKLTDGKGWELDKKSITVFNSVNVQNNRYGSPARFNEGEHATGVSDHWPIAARIYLKD